MADLEPPTDDLAELAALYALDILDRPDRDRADAAILDRPEFARQVAEFEATMAAIPYSAPPVPLAANLKDRLFQRIDSETPESELLQLLSSSIRELKQKAANLSWEPMASFPGAATATWKVDEPRRQVAFFVRSQTPGRFPKHWHAEGEEILVIEGDFIVDDRTYYCGDRLHADANTAHQPETATGCLLLCVSSLDDRILS